MRADSDNALFIGLMSGTSMDGIDAVLVEFQQDVPRLLTAHNEAIPTDLKQELQQLAHYPGNNEIERFGVADIRLGRLLAKAVLKLIKRADLSPEQKVSAIGSHGQTIRHRPDLNPRFTLQIGDPNTIAELTGITTVTDFRRHDMAAGGEGAPLVPAFHAAIFRDTSRSRTIVNIGGIANITVLPVSREAPVSGFDTGPGNTLLDAWIRKHLNQSFDRDGCWAATGAVDQELLEVLLQDPYFRRLPPKSTGPEYFNHNWLKQQLGNRRLAPANVQATLTQLTASSIAIAIMRQAPETDQLLICGGGIYNKTLVKALKKILPNLEIESTSALGIHPDWAEAMAFAWLARQTLLDKPGNLPAVTGAARSVILGGIYKP